MKKFLALVLGVVLFASCSSDNDDSVDLSKLSNKKWYPVSIKVLGATLPYEHENIQCGKDYSLFETGGVYKSVFYNSQCETFTDLGSWIAEGNTIITSEDGDITTLKIIKVTATELVVSAEDDYDENGTVETAVFTLTTNL